MLIQVLELLAVITAGIITGGAWAYTLEIHPALTKAPPRSSLDVFTPMFHHANRIQPLLGGLVAALTLAVSIMTGQWMWFLSALVMQTIGPYTNYLLAGIEERRTPKAWQ